MQTGTFQGIENGSMKIECPITRFVFDESGKSHLVEEKRIFSYPVGGDSYRDTFFRGFGPQEGTIGFRPDLPVIGQKIGYEGPTPDGAGHLMVYVHATEVFSGMVSGKTRTETVKTRFGESKRRTFSVIENVRRGDGSLARSHAWVPGPISPGPIRFIGAWTDSSSVEEPRTINFVKEVA